MAGHLGAGRLVGRPLTPLTPCWRAAMATDPATGATDVVVDM